MCSYLSAMSMWYCIGLLCRLHRMLCQEPWAIIWSGCAAHFSILCPESYKLCRQQCISAAQRNIRAAVAESSDWHRYRYLIGIGIGISLVSISVSHRDFSYKFSVLILGLCIGIGIGISWVSVSVSHWYRYRFLIGVDIGILSVSFISDLGIESRSR